MEKLTGGALVVPSGHGLPLPCCRLDVASPTPVPSRRTTDDELPPPCGRRRGISFPVGLLVEGATQEREQAFNLCVVAALDSGRDRCLRKVVAQDVLRIDRVHALPARI